MEMDVASSSVVDIYRMVVDVVTPRPIAWVSTINANGLVNVAPFSFYNAFGANPPVVVFSPTTRRDGTKKDTLLNIEANGEFVINASVESFADQVNMTSKEVAPDASEVELAKLSTVPSALVKPPRIAGVPFALECKLLQIVNFGDGPIAPNLVIGKIVRFYVDDQVLDSSGRIDPRKVKTIARLGGDYWCRTSDLFELKRP